MENEPHLPEEEIQTSESSEKSSSAVTRASDEHKAHSYLEAQNLLAEGAIAFATVGAGIDAWHQGLTNIDNAKYALLFAGAIKTMKFIGEAPRVRRNVNRFVSNVIGPDAISNDKKD